jgi:selenocysteine lyase/cysteine desulfurase
VWSGFNATDVDGTPMDAVPDPTRGPGKFQVSNPDPVAESRFAAALEDIAAVGVAAINGGIAERVTRIIDLADEFALPVTSPRALAERAGIVVVEPEPDRLTVLAAALHNHGLTVTIRAGHARLSPHASTDDETLAMLRAAFISYATAAS